MKRVVVASVGHTFERVFRAVARVGIGVDDTVLLFNSLPDDPRARKAMDTLRIEIERVFNAFVELYWLDPRKGFEENVREIRICVERYAPCRAYLLAVGGFRWLALALSYTALALNTLTPINRVEVEALELELEEDTATRDIVRKMFPTQESRVIRIPITVKLADIDAKDIEILKTIEKGYRRAKQLEKVLNIPRATLNRRLRHLVERKLLTFEPRGKSYLYKLTPLAKMLI